MNDALSMNALLDMLSTLSDNNKHWLADKLYEQVGACKECELDEAIKAAQSGPLYTATSIEQLMADLVR